MILREKEKKNIYIYTHTYIPWLVLESSALGLHNADTQVHNREESQTARLWQRMRGTRKNQVHTLSFQIIEKTINALN